VRREGKMSCWTAAFVKEQIIDLHRFCCRVGGGGGVVSQGASRRVLGLTFVVFFVLMEVVHGKNTICSRCIRWRWRRAL